MYVVNQSKQCAQIYLQKIACCFKLQLLILFFVKSIISDMHHRITYMYINFQQNWVCRSVKPCTLIYLHNIYRKLHKFATTNSNFFKNGLLQTCILVKRTCISIFSKIGFVDQSNRAHKVICTISQVA